MVVPSGKPVHARHRDGPHRRDDPAEPRPHAGAGRGPRGRLTAATAGAAALGLAVLLAVAAPAAAWAERLRIATYSVDLERDGPGLLLRDILSGRDDQVAAVVAVIAAVAPDALLLTGIDHDHGLAALGALADRLAAAGHPMPHRHAPPGNRGLPSGHDLDGDGRAGGADDALAWGRFRGAGGMALLSRLPLDPAAARDFTGLAWRDLPGRQMLPADDPVAGLRRLSTSGHWEVPVRLPGGGTLRLLAFHASPPVFGPPGGVNARRNHDEVALWLRLLDGALAPPPEGGFVILGRTNLDPADGDGQRAAIAALLAHPRLSDPRPRSAGAVAAAAAQGGANARHTGDPGLDTADFPDARGPGNLRVDVVLPSADLRVRGSGVHWPAPDDPAAAVAEAASRGRLVWVDIEAPAP
jgi:hypothetical protein